MITHQQFEKDFKAFIEAMGETLIMKNHDYTGAGADPLYNFRKAENIGDTAIRGAMIRFGDKVSRLETFLKLGIYKVKDESFEDTLKDAANYLFLIGELYKETKHDTVSKTS